MEVKPVRIVILCVAGLLVLYGWRTMKGDAKNILDVRPASVSVLPIHDDLSPLLRTAHEQEMQGQYNDAIASLQKAVAIAPTDSRPYIGMGIIYEELKDAQNSKESFKKAIELDPKNAQIYTQLGALQLSLEESDQGVQNLKKAIELSPHDSEPETVLGNFYMVRGQYSEALEAYEKANAIAPSGMLQAKIDSARQKADLMKPGSP